MLRKTNPLAATSAAIIFFVVPAWADTTGRIRNNPHWGKPAAGISCSIRADKAEYASGEDILLDVFIRNEANDSITVIRPEVLTTYVAPLHAVTVKGLHGECKFRGPIHSRPLPMPKTNYIALRPGEVVGASSYSEQPPRIVPEYWSLTEPGTYTIRYSFVRSRNWYWDTDEKKELPFDAWTGHAVSNTIEIRVRPAKRQD